MLRALSLLSAGSVFLILGGCAGMAGMDGKSSVTIETARPIPPPLPQAPPIKAPKVKLKREAAPPLPAPRPAPPVSPVQEQPPHKWYDHLKFWQK